MSEHGPMRAGGKARLAALGLLLAALVFGIYGKTLRFDFVSYDDLENVTGNERIRAGLTLGGLRWALSSPLDANWIPITALSHMATVQFFGLSAGAHHFVNVLLHALDAALLLIVLYLMTGALWRSAFVAALFAIHPLHVESVAWITERKDVLSAFFWLWTMFFYHRYARRPGLGRFVPVLAAFACGLMAKPMLVTLPFALLLMDYWPLGRLAAPYGRAGARPAASPGRLILEKTPLLLLAAVASAVTFAAQRDGIFLSPSGRETLLSNGSTALVAYARYLGKMLWPRNMAVFYPLETSLPAWLSGAAFLLLIALTGAFLYVRGRRPHLAVGWLWYLGTMVPVIGFVRIGLHSMADRYTYIPFIGLFIIAAWEMAAAGRSWGARALAGVAATVVAALSAVSWAQTDHWRNNRALFEHALAVTDNNWLAHNNVATHLIDEGRFDEALGHVEMSLRSQPDYANAYTNLGVIRSRRGDLPNAIAAFRMALSHDPLSAEAHYNLGLAYLDGGREGAEMAGAHYRALERLKSPRAAELLKFMVFLEQAPEAKAP